jgi:L-ribulose-5-phosphate 4-epimerase
MSDATNVVVAKCAEEFARVARRAWDPGLVAGSGGNMSMRIPGTDRLLIKPSGVAIVECLPETLLQVDLDGTVADGRGAPTRDLNFHLAIYRARSDLAGVIHAHVPWATSLTFFNYAELPLLTPHAQEKLGRVPVLPYFASGMDELSTCVSEAFSNPQTRTVLLGRHGMIAAAETLTAAEQVAELVEETAKIAMLVQLGRGAIVSNSVQ